MSDTRVKCGMCHDYHASVADMKTYHRIDSAPISRPALPPVPVVVNPPSVPQSGAVVQSGLPGNVGKVINGTWFITERQYFHLKDNLGQDSLIIQWWTKNYASTRISALHAEQKKRTAPVSNAPTSKIPVDMLKALPDGYYAARQSTNEDWNFFRVSRPKKNRYAGCVKIQTQHGPQLKEALILWPSGVVSLYSPHVENDILLMAVDPNGCGLAYGEVIGNCCKCGKDLTDPRSRWYGIGPDCEKRFPHFIDLINDRKGVFVHGS